MRREKRRRRRVRTKVRWGQTRVYCVWNILALLSGKPGSLDTHFVFFKKIQKVVSHSFIKAGPCYMNLMSDRGYTS